MSSPQIRQGARAIDAMYEPEKTSQRNGYVPRKQQLEQHAAAMREANRKSIVYRKRVMKAWESRYRNMERSA